MEDDVFVGDTRGELFVNLDTHVLAAPGDEGLGGQDILNFNSSYTKNKGIECTVRPAMGVAAENGALRESDPLSHLGSGFRPKIGCVSDTAVSSSFYKSLGFDVDSTTSRPGDDIHMLLYNGQFCAMLYKNADLKSWLPCLRDQPIGFAGMFYLSVDDLDATYHRISSRTQIIKPITTDHTGQRMFYIRDPDGYVISFNDNNALQSSDLGKYA
ncbi:hypothetical protein CNMCM7691_002334 [Aspergillus felis]|uniref:VOC domain-containing protein n=1 Tax=Aspergillus felis TaxID=1287682 RepID=A0A8H6R1B3_9EURO|nr:hypothetical protein CNMCM7691_002334 [Aspergillus felis]